MLLIGLTAFLLIRYPPETFHDFARSSFLLILALLLAVMLLADGAALRWLRRLTERLSQSFPEPSPSACLLQRLRGYISAAVMLSVILNSLISSFLDTPGSAWFLLLLVPLLFLSI